MCKRFRQDFSKFYKGNTARTDDNADWGGIAKTITEYYGIKIEDLSLTQINAYVLEIVKAETNKAKKQKGIKTQVINADTPLNSFKGLGVKITCRKR